MENEPLPSASPSSPSSNVEELRAQYNSLHSLLVSVLLLLIVIGGTFWVFLMRQAAYAKTDLGAVRVGYTNALVQFERTRPIIDETVKKLQDFGRTNADFVPILAKYNLLQAATSAPPATARPAKK